MTRLAEFVAAFVLAAVEVVAGVVSGLETFVVAVSDVGMGSGAKG